jgi:hypothetical protein
LPHKKAHGTAPDRAVVQRVRKSWTPFIRMANMISGTGARIAWLDLEIWAAAFEEAWQHQPGLALADFLPEREHPNYDEILCELICIDMELRWTHRCAKTLDDYCAEFPLLFADRAAFHQVAFEDYRQRVQAGEWVTPADYARWYGLNTAHLPRRRFVAEETRSESPPAPR